MDNMDLTLVDIKKFWVEVCERSTIEQFVTKYHYSHSINGLHCTYCFKLTYKNELIGAMIFGTIAMSGVWKKYAEKEVDILELRRLCCIDETPKNTESFFIGKALQWLKKNTLVKKIVSYADNEYNHVGIIYKATNFKYLGQTAPGKIIMYNGKRYHDKCIRTTYNGTLKPFAKKIKNAFETGEAVYKKTKPKNIYLYDLRP